MSRARSLRAKVASLTRSRKPNDPELAEAQKELATLALAQTITQRLANTPPLSGEQTKHLVDLITAGGERR